MDIKWFSKRSNLYIISMIYALSAIIVFLIFGMPRIKGYLLANIGLINLSKNHISESEYFLEKSIKLGRSSPTIYLGLSYIYESKGDYSSVISIIKQGFNRYPNYSPLAYSLGKYFASNNQPIEAIRVWRIGGLSNPIWELGKEAKDNDELEIALIAFQNIIEILPNNGTAYRLLGDIWKQFGDQNKALETYHQGIRKSPRYIWLYVAIGHIYRENGDFAQAESWYYEANKVDPNSDWPYYLLGYNAIKWGHIEEGCGYLHKSILLDNTNSNALNIYEEHCE